LVIVVRDIPVNSDKRPLRAKIAETILPAKITEQGENRNQLEKEELEKEEFFHRFVHGFTRRGTEGGRA
jgi:hypothetical protein